ncbi:outer membrane protein assembly factor BamB family protein [Nesterenkonia alkaliphila]|nr:PQQ-binding-like beta-propeller repeat protein [Nesterenkonia alkaliphila]
MTQPPPPPEPSQHPGPPVPPPPPASPAGPGPQPAPEHSSPVFSQQHPHTQHPQYPQAYHQNHPEQGHWQGQPPAGTPQGGTRRRSRLKLWIAAAVGVVVLGAAAALLLPRLLEDSAGAPENGYAIADLPERPVTGWRISYDFGATGADYYSQMTYLGGGEALLFSYAPGSAEEPDFYVEQPMTTSLTRIDLATGDQLWQVDLVEAVGWLESAQDSVGVFAGEDSEVIGVTRTDYGWGEERSATYIATLNPGTGEVLSEREWDREQEGAYLPLFDGDSVHLLLQTYEDTGSYPLAVSLDARSLEHQNWASEVSATMGSDYPQLLELGPYGTVLQHSGQASDSGQYQTYYLDPETGESIEALSEQDSVYYSAVGSVVLEQRYRSSGGATELRAYDGEQESQWDRPRSADQIWTPQGTLLVADVSERSMSLMRVDPADGQDMWDQPLRTPAAEVAPASDDQHIYLIDADGRFAVHDAATGDELLYGQLDRDQHYHFEHGSPVGFHPGEENLYIRGIEEVLAFDWEDGSEIWRWSYSSDSEHVFRIGEKLLLEDRRAHTWTALE